MLEHLRFSGSLFAITLVACHATSGSTRPEARGVARWSGSFKQPQMAASSIVGPARPNTAAAFGSITLTPVEGDANRVRVDMSVSAPVSGGTQLAWAIFTGPCGAPTPPVAGPNEFPLIEVTNNGGGMVRTTMSMTLEPRSEHHANVYWTGRVSDVSNVMMCANLAYSGAK